MRNPDLRGLFLVAPGDTLDGYEFSDEDHARRWIAQPVMVGSGYRIVRRKVRISCEHCGHRVPYGPAETFASAREDPSSTTAPPSEGRGGEGHGHES